MRPPLPRLRPRPRRRLGVAGGERDGRGGPAGDGAGHGGGVGAPEGRDKAHGEGEAEQRAPSRRLQALLTRGGGACLAQRQLQEGQLGVPV